jgi:hypothetical protein
VGKFGPVSIVSPFTATTPSSGATAITGFSGYSISARVNISANVDGGSFRGTCMLNASAPSVQSGNSVEYDAAGLVLAPLDSVPLALHHVISVPNPADIVNVSLECVSGSGFASATLVTVSALGINTVTTDLLQ